MIRIVPEKIDQYAAAHTMRQSPILEELARETHEKTAWPQMLVGPVEGAFLRFLVRVSRARRVLEIGTFTGYSALSMAEALPKNGQIITLDMDPESTAIAKRFWARSAPGRKIKLKLGMALESLRTLKGPFDLVFIDADKENYVNYWENLVPKVRRGGLLVADNVLWSGRVLQPKDATDRAIVAFNRHVRADKRVEVVLLTVRDGMTLAWKR